MLRIDEVANLYQQQYGAVLVDEFQDLSPQQLDLALRSCLGNRTFVGDPLQGIYSWAGAEPTAVEAELTALCGEPLRLTKSYRSSPAVLSMVNAVGVQLGAAELSSAIPGNWAVGAASAAVAFPTGADEASWVTARCSEILQQQPEATIGVIARSGWRRKLLNAGFAALPDIPCRHWDLAVDDPETIERLEHAANTLPRSANFTHLREKALADLNPDDVDGRSDILEAVAEIEEASAGEPSIRTAIRRYLRDEGDQAVMPGIHLLNAHTGKGQQFDWVFVPGLENGHVPDFRAVTADDLLEEQRVLLVMLSRAKASVVVSRSAQLTSKRGVPYSRDPSPWWSGLEAAATTSREQFEALTLAAPAGV